MLQLVVSSFDLAEIDQRLTDAGSVTEADSPTLSLSVSHSVVNSCPTAYLSLSVFRVSLVTRWGFTTRSPGNILSPLPTQALLLFFTSHVYVDLFHVSV